MWLWHRQSSPMYSATWRPADKECQSSWPRDFDRAERNCTVCLICPYCCHHTDWCLGWWRGWRSYMCSHPWVEEWPQVWAANETSVTLANTSMFNTLERTPESSKRPLETRQGRMAHTQLHALKWCQALLQRNTRPKFWDAFWKDQLQQSGPRGCPMSEDSLNPSFEGLFSAILLSAWTTGRQLCCNLDRFKECMPNWNSQLSKPNVLPRQTPPLPPKHWNTSTPMDIDQNKCRPETHRCYNAWERSSLMTLPEPQKQQVQLV